MDVCIYMTRSTQNMKNVVVPNILLRVVVAGTETEENKKDLWKMILEVYGALRKCSRHTHMLQSISIYS